MLLLKKGLYIVATIIKNNIATQTVYNDDLETLRKENEIIKGNRKTDM
jgi:hypothetical protein